MTRRSWKGAEVAANGTIDHSNTLKAGSKKAEEQFKFTDGIGQHLLSNVENRTHWLELLAVVAQCLPQADPAVMARPVPQDYHDRDILLVTNIDCRQMDDVAAWWQGVKQWYQPMAPAGQAAPAGAVPPGPAPKAAAGAAFPGLAAVMPAGEILFAQAPPGGSGGGPAAGDAGSTEGPTGPGTVVQISGHHYHNKYDRKGGLQGAEYVRAMLLRKLDGAQIRLPEGEVPVKSLGVSYPVLVAPDGTTKRSSNRWRRRGPATPRAAWDLTPRSPAATCGSTP